MWHSTGRKGGAMGNYKLNVAGTPVYSMKA